MLNTHRFFYAMLEPLSITNSQGDGDIMANSAKKYNVETRGGKVVEVVVNPPTPPGKEIEPGTNGLEFVRIGLIAVKNVQCEKCKYHQFDGTLATHVVSWRFKQSRASSSSPLCESCADELYGHMNGFFRWEEPVAPSCNTGVTKSFLREGV